MKKSLKVHQAKLPPRYSITAMTTKSTSGIPKETIEKDDSIHDIKNMKALNSYLTNYQVKDRDTVSN